MDKSDDVVKVVSIGDDADDHLIVVSSNTDNMNLITVMPPTRFPLLPMQSILKKSWIQLSCSEPSSERESERLLRQSEN